MLPVELMLGLKVSAPFDAFEYHPVRIIDTIGDEQVVEVCEPEEAEFWSVYVHTIGLGLECIADCDTKDRAIELIAFLESITTNYHAKQSN